jgi:hypothetical protein
MPPEAEELPELGNTADDRDTLLAEMRGLGDDDPTPDDTADLSQEEPTAAESEEEPSEDAETPEEEAETAPETAEEPEEDESLAKMQAAERRHKERVAADRAELAREREAWAAEQQQAKAELEAAKKPEPKTPDELYAAARQAHALWKASQADSTPQEKAAAERMQAESAAAAELRATRDELKELKAELKADKEEAANRVQAEKFTDHLVAGITDETPLVKNLLTGKGKSRARERILNIAAYLHSQSGESPDPIDVFKIYEESERADLEERGIDPDAVLKATTTPKTKTPDATEKKSATLGNDLAISTPPRSEPLTEEEERADMLKGMAGLSS